MNELLCNRLVGWVLTTGLAGCSGQAPMAPTAPGPPQTYTLSGIVSEPAGETVPGVRVQVGNQTTTTDADGRYTIGGLLGGVIVEISKDGFETQRATAVLGGDRALSVTLPPVIRISAGGRTTVTLYPGEPSYWFPAYLEECSSPCKIVRVTSHARGLLSLTLTAHDPTRRLSVFVQDGWTEYCCAYETTTRPLAVADGGEVIFYVTLRGVMGTPQQIDIATSFRLE